MVTTVGDASADTTVQPDRQEERLYELGQQSGVPVEDPFVELFRPQYPETTPVEINRIQETLLTFRINKYESKKRYKLLRSNPSKKALDLTSITVAEATNVLQEFINTKCSAGEAFALVGLGADVNNSTATKVKGKPQDGVGNSMFTQVVQSNDVNMVNVLAHKADQTNLDAGLKIALKSRNIDILHILMIGGANPNFCETEYHAAIEANDVEIISILLSGALQLDDSLATAGLYEMVRRRNMDIVRMLLIHGANADTRKPSPLEFAIDGGHIVDATVLCMADKFPLPDHLSKCLGRVCAKTQEAWLSKMDPMKLRLVQVLLAAGAKGDEVNLAFVQAITRRQQELVQLFVGNSDFDVGTMSKALQAAIRSTDIKLFLTILACVRNAEVLDDAFLFLQTSSARKLITLDRRTRMTIELVRVGISEQKLTKALYDAVENEEVEIIKCLIKAGASVDDQNGRALSAAVKQRSMILLDLLLSSKRISTVSLSNTFRSLNDLPLSSKLPMARTLLAAGARGIELDKMLQQTISQGNQSLDGYALVQALLQAGASVDVGPKGCLISAIETNNPKVFDLLKGHIPSRSNLEPAFSASNGLRDLDFRYNVMQTLLSAGASGPFVTRALVDVLERIPREKRFSRLLVLKGKPDPNLFEGKVVGQAVQHQDVELLKLLINLKPSITTLSNAMRTAMGLGEGEARIQICEILLKAGAKGLEVDNALLRATVLTPCEMNLVRLLIKFGASIDHKSGSALHMALENFDMDLLDLLVQQPAKVDTINRAMTQALALATEDQKFRACKSLLGAKTKLPSQTLGTFLGPALEDGEDLRVFQLLLDHGASVDVKPLEVYQKAISTNNKAVMHALMLANPSTSTVQEVFEYAWRARATNGFDILLIITQKPSHCSSISLDEYLVLAVEETPNSVLLIKFLTGIGASPLFSGCKSLLIAARRLDRKVLDALLSSMTSEQVNAIDFRLALKLPEFWTKPNGQDCFKTIVQACKSKEILSETLLYAVTQYKKLPNAPSFVDHLVAYGASPDYNNGFMLVKATETADVRLVSRLLEASPSSFTINNAFPYIFLSTAEADVINQLITIFIAKAKSKLDLNAKHKELDPVMFLCVDRADKSVKMLTNLIKAGAFVDQKCQRFLKLSDKKEEVSVLMKVLDDMEPFVPAETSTYLIDQGANVNYVTSSSKLTPLLAACQNHGSGLVAKLIQKGAKVSVQDSAGRSPLFWAARTDNIQNIQALLKAKAPANDGSLHESIALGNLATASLLLGAGHNPDHPSSLHDRQVALEVALKQSHKSLRQDTKTWQAIFELLYKKGAAPTYISGGKSLLIMALDLMNAGTIVPSLLKAFMGKMINKEFNRFVKNNVIYSPISYVKQGKNKAPKSQKNTLVATLNSYGCEEVFYHETGPQPKGFKGAPAFLVQRENEYQEELRRKAEAKAEHELAMRRLKEQAEARMKAEQEAHAAAERRRKAEMAAQELAAEKAHQAELKRLRRQKELAREAIELEAEKNKALEASLKRQNKLQLDGIRQRRMEEELGYQSRLEMQAFMHAMNQGQIGYGYQGQIGYGYQGQTGYGNPYMPVSYYGARGYALPGPPARRQITGRVFEEEY